MTTLNGVYFSEENLYEEDELPFLETADDQDDEEYLERLASAKLLRRDAARRAPIAARR